VKTLFNDLWKLTGSRKPDFGTDRYGQLELANFRRYRMCGLRGVVSHTAGRSFLQIPNRVRSGRLRFLFNRNDFAAEWSKKCVRITGINQLPNCRRPGRIATETSKQPTNISAVSINACLFTAPFGDKYYNLRAEIEYPGGESSV
jgi:hypothetical protein